MRRIAIAALAGSCLAGGVPAAKLAAAAPAEARSAESPEDRARFDAAIALHDRGEYDAAVAAFRDLLATRPDDPKLLCEMANSLTAAGKTAEAIAPAERAVAQAGAHRPFCSMVLGVALDAQGDFKRGEKVFRKAIKQSPDAPMLHFNFGVNQSLQKRPEAAIGEFQEAIRLKPSHASSWRALAMTYQGQRMRPQAFTAFSRFLSLEPSGPRAAAAAPQLEALLFEGIEHKGTDPATGQDSINISIPADSLKKDEAGALDLSMSMVAANRFIEEWKDRSDAEFFAHAFETVLAIFGEMGNSGGRKSEFWNASVMPYFRDARAAGHLTTLAYEVRRSSQDGEVAAWLEAHAAEVEAYRGWSAAWNASAKTGQ